jgi:hypothetical protein
MKLCSNGAVIVAAESDLHNATMEVLKECQIARSAGAPVLLLLFGHGDGRTYGVELGKDSILRIGVVPPSSEMTLD